jgi:flagellar hook-associated protein 3 FlgL
MTRVSDKMRFASTDNRIASAKAFSDEAQETAISGRRLRSISTDPVATVRILRNRSKLENIGQFRKTIDFAKGYLSKTEDALRDMSESLMRCKELAVQQSNGTWDAQTRSIVGEEVRNLADQVVQLGNTTFADKYIFGGFRNGQPPISPDGTYAGDDGIIFVQVDEDSFRPINVLGRDIFEVKPENEATGEPLVQTIRGMFNALGSNDVDHLRKAMSRLDVALDQTIRATSSIGAKQAALDGVATRLERGEETFLADNNQLEGSDQVKMAMELKRAEGALNFTLQSSSNILQPTLLNFLK